MACQAARVASEIGGRDCVFSSVISFALHIASFVHEAMCNKNSEIVRIKQGYFAPLGAAPSDALTAQETPLSAGRLRRRRVAVPWSWGGWTPPYEHLQLRPLTRGASPRPRSAPPGPPRKARPPALRRASCAAPLGPAVSPSATLQRGWPRFAWRAGLRPPSGYRVLGHPAVPVRGRATPDGSPQAFAPRRAQVLRLDAFAPPSAAPMRGTAEH